MAHKLIYRPLAEEDLEAIYSLIAQDSPARAFNFVEQIQQRCDLLRNSPEQGRKRPDLRSGLRVIPYGRSVVIAYQVPAIRLKFSGYFTAGRTMRPS